MIELKTASRSVFRIRYQMSLCVDKSGFSISSMTRDMPDRIEFPKDNEFQNAKGGRFD
jgi:hypothetical protein